MRTLAHVTHEAVQKVGGIGAVLQGLLTSQPYRSAEVRTILIGPFFAGDASVGGRLGPDGEVLYSSADGITRHPVAEALDHVRRDYHVNLVYGHRRIYDPHGSGTFVTAEVVLIDVSRMDLGRVNAFKGKLWHAYRLDSSRYEHSWEYDLYVKLAEPALAVLHALGAADFGDECVVLAHEFMGMPTALAARLDPSGAFKTVFYAHEVATMRRIVEGHPGHDLAFYNALSVAMESDRHVEDVFGFQDYYRHALVRLSHHCDKIFAVGDYVAKELRFLGREFDEADIEVTYNGIPAERITMDQKRASCRRMRDYAETLLGYRPDYIFTHVTRMSPSKGLWRDLRVLEHMEAALRERGKTAVLFVLSTEVPARRPEDVRRMEQWYNWPAAHRESDPDLSYGEALFYQGVQEFNLRGRTLKLVYVNQFGWERGLCGERMPADMTFLDIRRGSDVEFGQSIYEPFGIAPLEPLTYGGICVVSNVCGCAGFVERVANSQGGPNVIVADYCDMGSEQRDEASLLSIGREERDRYEARVAETVARQVLQALPTDDASTAALLNSGYELAQRMSWDVVAGEYVLPSIDHACTRLRAVRVA